MLYTPTYTINEYVQKETQEVEINT